MESGKSGQPAEIEMEERPLTEQEQTFIDQARDRMNKQVDFWTRVEAQRLGLDAKHRDTTGSSLL